MASRIFGESVNTPKRLYKFLMRECQKLPTGAQEFYKHTIRQSFKQYVIEPDPVRVQQIMDKALHDAEWVLRKYKIDVSPKGQKS